MMHYFDAYPGQPNEIERPVVTSPEDYGLIQPAEHIAYWSAHGAGLADAARFYVPGTALPAGNASTHLLTTIMAREFIRDGISHDQTRVALAEQEYAGTHDPKTGLLNEAGLNLAIASIDEPRNYLFVYADGTNFRAVDQLLGEKKVNVLFQEMADVMKASMRKDDVIARPYGDTYVALVDVRPKGNSRRRGDVPVNEQAAIIRRRVDSNMRQVLERHDDAQVLGFQLAVGVVGLGAADSLQDLINLAKADMKPHKAEQHAALGQHRTNPS